MPCTAAATARQRAAELCYALRATLRETLYEDAALLAAADHLTALLPAYTPPAPPHDEPARRRLLVQLLGRHDTVEGALAVFRAPDAQPAPIAPNPAP